ncbi:molybdopterin-dependent oxidoreductase [Jatrophihabitans sp.]|uniref:molybdopterin-dependent oxidoreductase n=1 Tax=Jatrophihabitans sp. TaxID=1932789 RepID=UPI002C8A97DD|nr:molybdopterin-dependent oxidoreductase [Jatrophihabitans sp.]
MGRSAKAKTAPRLGMLLARKPPFWPAFSARLRSEAVTARVGSVLGVAFGLCFATGLLSHYQYAPWAWLPIPAAPVWGYRLSQGIHVITGLVSIPLLITKLWSVFPKLFQWPPARSVVHALERLSVAVLVSASLVEVGIGLLNILTWYPWRFSFIDVHHWLAWVVLGSLLLHIAVKLPVIRRGLADTALDQPPASDTASDTPTAPDAQPAGGISRRGVLIASGAGAGIVALTTAGQSLTPLRSVALLGVREPQRGPLGVPINRTAAQADVRQLATAATYRLQISGRTPFDLTLAELEAMSGVHRSLPIACVEGWSAGARWIGIELMELVTRAGGTADSRVVLTSLEADGPFRRSAISGPQLRAALLATHLNGQRLTLDHGYPLRLIAPNRAGVFNTKWLSGIAVGR